MVIAPGLGGEQRVGSPLVPYYPAAAIRVKRLESSPVFELTRKKKPQGSPFPGGLSLVPSVEISE
jgi:hypothetical protein